MNNTLFKIIDNNNFEINKNRFNKSKKVFYRFWEFLGDKNNFRTYINKCAKKHWLLYSPQYKPRVPIYESIELINSEQIAIPGSLKNIYRQLLNPVNSVG